MPFVKRLFLFFAIIGIVWFVPFSVIYWNRSLFFKSEFRERERIALDLSTYQWPSNSTSGRIVNHTISVAALPKHKSLKIPKVIGTVTDLFCIYTVFEFETPGPPGAAKHMEIGNKFYRVVGN